MVLLDSVTRSSRDFNNPPAILPPPSLISTTLTSWSLYWLRSTSILWKISAAARMPRRASCSSRPRASTACARQSSRQTALGVEENATAWLVEILWTFFFRSLQLIRKRFNFASAVSKIQNRSWVIPEFPFENFWLYKVMGTPSWAHK